MQSLLRQRKRLKQENEELRTQMSASGPFSKLTPSKLTNNHRRTDEASFLGNTEFSSGSYTRWFEKEVLLARQTSSSESIGLNTPFFKSLAKKSHATMDDLFRRADKYSMLEDNVRAATQQVLVTNRPTKDYEA
ncbi:hypothetical protein CK203_027723 [Vitis vinifera]|uniref:Uncharacterized protein n=1 Tax=Vitis vinifera TaxID=29760 RepID=A0A438IGY5_VITVI|nr:hypothetical protein CK203_027723 [Vitis vinifera]